MSSIRGLCFLLQVSFFFFGCEIFLTVGALGALGTFLSRKFLYQLCLYSFKPSLLFILQSQLPLGSPHVSLLVFEFSGLFVLPFFMLSVLITRGHAQLIPLWLTAGLADRLFGANRGTLHSLNQKRLKMPYLDSHKMGTKPTVPSLNGSYNF